MSIIDAPGRLGRGSLARTDPIPVQGNLSRPVVLVAGAIVAVLADLVGWLTFNPVHGVAELWPASMAMFVTLAAY